MSDIRVNRECVKVFSAGYEERKRHRLYEVLGKEGTTASTILYFIDKVPKLGESCLYISTNDLRTDPFDKKSNFSLICSPYVKCGIVDRINEDGYCFVYPV